MPESPEIALCPWLMFWNQEPFWLDKAWLWYSPEQDSTLKGHYIFLNSHISNQRRNESPLSRSQLNIMRRWPNWCRPPHLYHTASYTIRDRLPSRKHVLHQKLLLNSFPFFQACISLYIPSAALYTSFPVASSAVSLTGIACFILFIAFEYLALYFYVELFHLYTCLSLFILGPVLTFSTITGYFRSLEGCMSGSFVIWLVLQLGWNVQAVLAVKLLMRIHCSYRLWSMSLK